LECGNQSFIQVDLKSRSLQIIPVWLVSQKTDNLEMEHASILLILSLSKLICFSNDPPAMTERPRSRFTSQQNDIKAKETF